MDEEVKKELTPRQELFCKYFASDREFFGNGVQAYGEAYNIDFSEKGAYASARSAAWRLLTNVDILARINELLEDDVLNDAFVDKQLALIITQNAEFNPKMQAIKEYNALKKRITHKIEIDMTPGEESLEDLVGDITNARNNGNDLSVNSTGTEPDRSDSIPQIS